MNIFTSSISHRSFIWQLTALCFILGLILSATWRVVTQFSRAGTGPQREGFVYGSSMDTAKKLEDYQSEIKHLRDENQKLNDELARRKGGADTINQELKDARKFAGLTDLVGPGVEVILNDNKKQSVSANEPYTMQNLIHDTDIEEVVNELRASGAEAIAVNGQRIVATSAIRCVGPVIQVNGVPTTPPYVIQAIGDPNALWGGLNLPGGLLQQLREVSPAMVKVERVQKLHIPAYAGSTQMRYGRVPASSDVNETTK